MSNVSKGQLAGQRGAVIWLTGLSGAGKTTLACALARALRTHGVLTYCLDGDVLREGLCSDLGFSPADRAENIRRVGEVAALMADAGLVVTAAFISPYAEGRAAARRRCPAGRFVEVHVATPLAICRERDVKGLYARADVGEIEDLTGVGAPYEAPEAPDVRVGDAGQPTGESVAVIVEHLQLRGFLGRGPSNLSERGL